MTTLVDELENDFAASGSEEERTGEEDEEFEANGQNGGMDVDDDDEETHGAQEVIEDAEEKQNARGRGAYGHDKSKDGQATGSLKSVRTFMKNMQPTLEVSPSRDAHDSIDTQFAVTLEKVLTASWHSQEVHKYLSSSAADPQQRTTGLIEDDPQYSAFQLSNTYSTTIDDQITTLHKYIRDHYSTRFPELETLIPDARQYAKAVAIIRNGPMDALPTNSSDNIVGQPLSAVLSRPVVMTVTVEASTTRGTPLSESALTTVLDACSMVFQFDAAQREFTAYVVSRLKLFAPNLRTLIGDQCAAQLLNARGGLAALASTRAANLPSIGVKRFTASGLASNTGIRNQGFLYDTDIIKRFRPELRIQAMRIVSAKIVLAARVDLAGADSSGNTGEDMLEQCEKRLDKLLEVPASAKTRALPAPDDKGARKRGGRRARKAKEATAMTDLRKAQNRMAFGREEAEAGYGTGDSTKGLGMIGQANDGRIRGIQVDSRTRAKLSKKNAGWGTGMPANGAASSLNKYDTGNAVGAASVLNKHGLRANGMATGIGTAGTASSLAFSQKQGLELVDPKARADMERRSLVDQDRYFKGGTFTQISGGKTSAEGKKDADGFKVPAIPLPSKK